LEKSVGPLPAAVASPSPLLDNSRHYSSRRRHRPTVKIILGVKSVEIMDFLKMCGILEFSVTKYAEIFREFSNVLFLIMAHKQ
jgi:hypothetical protein